MFQNFGAVAILALICSSTTAIASCYKPDAPSCATDYGAFDDQFDFDNCKSEMESFKGDVESFLECQKRESQEAVDDYNDAIRSFNNRAQGY
jgi:hypothetical protein